MALPAPQIIGLADWKAAAARGEAPVDARLRKQYIADAVKADGGEESRKLTFIISTGAVDRDRDTLKVDGWNLENYLKNPVVLWAHYYGQPPVGKAEAIVKGAGVLRATAEFATKEDYPFADTVFRLLKGAYLRATSVGFRPIKWAYNEDRRGYDIEEMELLEFSVVPVPANPEALLDAKAAGVDLVPLKSWAEQVLGELEPGLWLPKSVAERALKIAAGEPASVAVPPSSPTPADPPPAAVPKTPAPAAPEFFVPTPDQVRASIRSTVSDLAQKHVNRALGRLD